MPKFKTRPTVVEAKQFWPEKKPWPKEMHPTSEKDGAVLTPKGWHYLSAGDWIVKDAKGFLSVCSPEAFEKKYEPIGKKKGDRNA